jgi:hypothetical protein
MRSIPRKGVFALLAVLGVLVIFLQPAVIGSYSATHGPATDLVDLAAAFTLFGAIAVVFVLTLRRYPNGLRSLNLPAVDCLHAPPVMALRC